MGTKNCQETPRQKMINMMYIVLTAMLALNVAAEVLEAYRVVDNSLLQTLASVGNKNQQLYASFEQAYAENPAKTEEWKVKADKVRTNADELVRYITALKEQIVIASGAEPLTPDRALQADDYTFVTTEGETLIIKKEDDLNTPSNIMIAQKEATSLKEKIGEYREFMINTVDGKDENLRNSLAQELETANSRFTLKDGERRTWESLYFENKPLAAVLTILSKLQIDVKNTETNVLNYLYSKIDAGAFKFNKLGAQVIASSNVVMQGEEYKAEIFIAAMDTTVNPVVIVGGRELPIVDGKGIYRMQANEVGVFKWNGMIKYKTPEGIIQDYPFSQEFQVTAPSATISPTKMNVFYRGLPNPIDVSAPGVPKENLRVEMTNGRIEQRGNAYFVYPSEVDEQGRRTKVSVYARFGDSQRLMGTMDFRVKNVPTPVAQVGSQSGGIITKERLLVEDGVFAALPDFDFDMKFTVTQFDVNITGAGGFTNNWSSNSNRFTADQKAQFRNLAPGARIFIENIKAKGDDGTTRDLASISFKIR